MKNKHEQFTDNASAVMILDIIENVLSNADNIVIAGKIATKSLRELSGAHAVILGRIPFQDINKDIYIAPQKRECIKESTIVKILLERSSQTSAVELIEDLNTEQLSEVGIENELNNAIIAPLLSSDSHIGSLILLGLPESDWGHKPLLRVITLMTDILALTLRAAISHEKQEQIISARNAELINANKVLVEENTRRRNAESKLQEYNINLERIVQKRTAELIDKNDKLNNEISERKHAEKQLKNATSQLIQTEKLVSIGQLAAGVAHEINSPLGAIASSNDIIKNHFEEVISLFIQKYGHFNNYLPLLEKVINNQKANDKCCSFSSRELRKVKAQINENLKAKGVKDYHAITEFILNTSFHDDYESYISVLEDTQDKDILPFIQNIATIMQCTNITDIAIQQSSKVIDALRNFARSEDGSSRINTNIKDTLETAITLYGNVIKHGLDLELNFETVPDILGYPSKLSQVWTNLIQNAAQAMNYSGTLTISLLNKKDIIEIIFSDCGCGIPENIIDRIFDPLFTTKKPGEGTGLGLDIVKQIIDKHDGTISVKSEVNKGTEFTIQLPVK